LNNFFAKTGALLAARVFLIFSQLISLPILARLLALEDFAIVALAMIVPIFVNLVSDAGLGRSLIKSDVQDQQEWSSVFWLLAGVGLVLGVIVLALAPLAAWYFEQPRVLAVMMALSVLPLIQSLSTVYGSDLERDDRFGVIATVLVTTSLVSLLVTIVLAFWGAGLWALVVQQILIGVVRCAGLFYASKFRPSLSFSYGKLKHHIKFGRDILGFSFIMVSQAQLLIVLFSQFFGIQAVAFWSMSERLMQLPRMGLAGPVSRVTYVRMGRASSSDIADLYIASMRILALIIFPVMAMLAASSEAVFTVLLSERWAEMGSIFSLAAAGVAIETVSSPGGGVFMAANRTGIRVRMALERFLALLVCLALAVPFGFEATVLARSLWAFAFIPRYWWFVASVSDLTVQRCAFSVLPAALLSAFGWMLHIVIIERLELSMIGEIGLAMMIGLAVVASILLITRQAVRFDVGVLKRPLDSFTGGSKAPATDKEDRAL